MSLQVQLKLLPAARCLFDEPVQVKVCGLKSRQLVSLRAETTDDRGVAFRSTATYRADGHGEVDLHRDPSLGGSYSGVQPMGPLWSMKPDTLHSKIHKTRALNPHVVRFSVHEEDGSARLLAQAVNKRLMMADDVTRTPIDNGTISGVLFTPPGPGPFPAVLDLYTSGGGLSERRPALLASRGFMVLTVGLYGYSENQTKNKIHLDYLEKAIEFLREQDQVSRSKGVGLISLSKSGDLALSAASFLSGVRATVWINGCCSNTILPLFYRNQLLLPPLMYDPRKSITTEAGVMVKNTIFDPRAEEHAACVVPIERAQGHFLLVAAEDDLNWDSKAFLEQMVERLRHHGKNNFEVLTYPGAGHYLEPPYGPYCPSSSHILVGRPVLWGGEASIHAAAEVHLWKKIQEFFRGHLASDGAQVQAKI